MNIADIIKYFGSYNAAAKQLGVTRQAIQHWRKFGVPYGRQCQIELQTCGALKAEKQTKAA